MSLPYRRAQVQERCAFLPKLPPGAPEGGSPAGIPPPNPPDVPPLPPFAVTDVPPEIVSPVTLSWSVERDSALAVFFFESVSSALVSEAAVVIWVDVPESALGLVSDEVQPVQAMAAAIAMLMAQAKHLCCIVCTLPFVFTAPCCDGFIVVVFPLS